MLRIKLGIKYVSLKINKSKTKLGNHAAIKIHFLFLFWLLSCQSYT